MRTDDLHGLTVISLESRNQAEMARLLARQGADVIEAPSLREVALDDQAHAIDFGQVLMDGGCDVLVLLTGVGARMLVDAMAMRFERARLVEAMGRAALVCRGPKPVAALKSLGLRPTITAPEPNTWRELLASLDEGLPIAGKRVAVQAYGRVNDDLIRGLEARGGQVRVVPIYAWQLPEDTAPLSRAIDAAIAGEANAILFTSAQQVEHLMQVAGSRAETLRQVLLERLAIASVGPVTTEALEQHGLTADVHPERPKMGHLARALAERAKGVLARKART